MICKTGKNIFSEFIMPIAKYIDEILQKLILFNQFRKLYLIIFDKIIKKN